MGSRAAAAAHLATGAPIGTHTEKADWALEQARFLCDAGVEPRAVLIGHLDFRPELPYLLEIADVGVHLGLDQWSKEKYLSDEERVRVVVGLAAEGLLDRIVLSGDLARRSYWPGYGHVGAPGLAHVPVRVREMLLAEGLSEDDVHTLTDEEPPALARVRASLRGPGVRVRVVGRMRTRAAGILGLSFSGGGR
ncbi:MAG: hypothetical protein U5J97_02355 [Trueperaceae bacterium]|nr:hypothetical protein [Trueperaceae bacterium]